MTATIMPTDNSAISDNSAASFNAAASANAASDPSTQTSPLTKVEQPPATTLIIGGGIVGASLALKLAQAKRSVTLIDARPRLTQEDWQHRLKSRDARVYALSLASIELLTQVGAWQQICHSGRKADYTQMQVWQTNGMGELNFGDSDKPELLGSMVEPSVIEHALYRRLYDADIQPYLTHVAGHQVTGIDWLGAGERSRGMGRGMEKLAGQDRRTDSGGYRVTLDNGDSHDGVLLVGADGRGSMVRQQAGIGLDTLDYQQTAICCAIRTEQPHRATARQVMLPTGSLALLPLADIAHEDTDAKDTDAKYTDPENIAARDRQPLQHWQSVVWTLPSATAQQMLAISTNQLADELSFASGYVLGKIERLESIASFALSAQQAQRYVQPNLALVGDAAHGVHPLAGQGLNLGLLDVQVLVETLLTDYQRSAGRIWGHDASLQRYQRQRRQHNRLMMHSFSLINWLFAGQWAQSPIIQSLRAEGMYRVGRMPAAMRFFTQQASGISG